MKIYGITGWKDQGKTTLVERLVAHFTDAGLSVSTIKHAHHAFDVDQEGRDSYRHRAAGASEVILASRKRFAVMHELRGEAEWELEGLLTKLSPVDLVLVEGYKNNTHRKLEVFREANGREPLALTNPSVRGIIGDASAFDLSLPAFDIDDIPAIAAFIQKDAE